MFFTFEGGEAPFGSIAGDAGAYATTYGACFSPYAMIIVSNGTDADLCISADGLTDMIPIAAGTSEVIHAASVGFYFDFSLGNFYVRYVGAGAPTVGNLQMVGLI